MISSTTLPDLPEHHHPRGGFQNPWATADGEERRALDFFRWQWQRIGQMKRLRRAAHEFPTGTPDLAYPASAPAELRITWVGQSTFLIQVNGINILTDPVWSLRASPLSWLGPTRLTQPGIPFDRLPQIHAVLLSHDHYDHLDSATVRRLAKRNPDAQWFAPLRHAEFLHAQGVTHLREFDWWQQEVVRVRDRDLRLHALPVQHWTRRLGSPYRARLWCSWGIETEYSNIYFAGDSGYCPAFAQIGERHGPFDVALLPIGAYEPRWFMRMAHMNPEEALQAFVDLRARRFVAMHWATFQLTDEDPLEPAQRIRAAWHGAGLPEELLHVLGVGGTLTLTGLPHR